MNNPQKVLMALAMALMMAWPALSAAQDDADNPKSAPETQEDAAEYPYGLSEYEWLLVKKMMDRHGLQTITRKEAVGKTIEAIIVEPEDVFTPEDIVPDFLNIFHVTSQKYIVRREVLMDEGDTYDQELAWQSERNLRGPPVLAVALVLPMQGSAPDTVKLLVVTKDIWSLRTNTQFQFVGGSLDFLAISLSENNIAGTHKFVALTSLLRPETLRLGQTYLDPRLFGTRLRLSESFSVPFNRDSGEPEGFTAQISIGKPLFSLRTPWAWDLDLTAHSTIGRSFVGGQVRELVFPDPSPPPINHPALIDALGADPSDRLLGATGSPQIRGADGGVRQVTMPFIWRERFLEVEASMTRSFGREIKQNLTWGYELGVRRYSFGQDDAQRDSFTQAQVAAFEDALLPRSERFGGVFVSYRVFEPDFVQLRNFETLALAEDFRFGPSLTLGASHSDPLLGSQFRFQRLSASFAQRWLLGDRDNNPSRNGDVAIISASAGTRVQDGEFQDNSVSGGARNYSPVFLGGRLVTRAGFVVRFNDQSNSQSAIGGDGGLRGFASDQFLARSVVTSNVEWRTMPWDLWTIHFSGALFYDMAWLSTEERFKDLSFFHGTGLGVRFMNPFSNRVVFRIDWGVPLNGPTPGFPGRFALNFEQAF
mgnify:CR=1 FL=1